MLDTAVLLAAGEGSRLRPSASFKPLCRVAGVTLIDHAIAGLATAGITRVIVVTGYGASDVEAHLDERAWPVRIEVVRTPDWRLPNGVSALAAAPLIGASGAVLAMCDHYVDPSLYARLAKVGARAGVVLGVDRRLGHPWVDPDDVTCVRTQGDRIVAIGKELAPHDAYDTGIFAVGPPFFAALASLAAPSITEAVRLLADANAAHVEDCSGIAWIDVDDPVALAHAETAVQAGRERAGH